MECEECMCGVWSVCVEGVKRGGVYMCGVWRNVCVWSVEECICVKCGGVYVWSVEECMCGVWSVCVEGVKRGGVYMCGVWRNVCVWSVECGGVFV